MARRSRRRKKSSSDVAVLMFVALIGAFTNDTGRQIVTVAAIVTVIVVVVVLSVRARKRPGRAKRFRRHRRNGVDVETLRQMDPYDFEAFTAQMLREVGFKNVRADGGAGDLAADVTGTSPSGMKTVVQCKRYAESNKVTSSEMQLFAGMAYLEHRADLAMYVTTSTYTKPAEDLGRRHRIVLLDADNIVGDVRAELDAAGAL